MSYPSAAIPRYAVVVEASAVAPELVFDERTHQQVDDGQDDQHWQLPIIEAPNNLTAQGPKV